MGITQWKDCKICLRICKHKEIRYFLRSSWRASTTNDSTNNLNPTSAPKIQKLKLGVRKLRRGYIKWSNPCGNQATHFAGCTESFSAKNSSCNCKKIRTTFDARPIICISSTNEGKTQVKWAVIVRWKVWKWIRINNFPPNGSFCHVLDYDEMTMRSSCRDT